MTLTVEKVSASFLQREQFMRAERPLTLAFI